MKITFYDTETSGLPDFKAGPESSTQPRVIQIAGIQSDENGNVLNQVNLIINPEQEGFVIPEQASNVHGITTENMNKDGIPSRIGIPVFMKMFNTSDLVVAHNISFDNFLMRSECLKLGLEKNDVAKFCTMKSSTNIVKIPPTEKMVAAGFTNFKSPNLQEAHKFFFGESFEGAHDAFADVKACMRVYFELKRRGV